MYAKTYNQRGFASLESFKSRSSGKQKLGIRLPKTLMGDKSYYLSLGLDDTPKNRAYAERKIEVINSDIFNEVFDSSLLKYKPKAKESPVTQIKKSVCPSIVALYEKYIEVRRSQVSPNTYAKN